MSGLIPTLIDWISLDEERKLVIQAFDLEEEIKVLPILMCPDDCDLSCTIVVAEVVTSNEQVKWNRIGIDTNNPKELIKKNRFLNTGVKWLSRIPRMTFSKDDYRSLGKIYKPQEQ
ncbi:hypothetical protein D3C76_1153970 [compost metagenome]